jgi:hypothetical protein
MLRVCLLGALLFCNLVSAQSALEFHGYLQGRLTRQPGVDNRMEIRRARLSVLGTPLSNFSYKFQVDFAKTPYLMDASVAYRFLRPLTVAIGQMKIPFSAESLISDDKNAPVARSRAVLALAPGRDTGVQGRDVGAQTSGTIGSNGRTVDYAAGVFRGQTFVNAPRIHYNATAGRIMLHPLHGSSMGADWYGSFAAPPGRVKRRLDFEGDYERGRASFRAEQILARDGTLERRGGYVLGVWRVNSTLETLARADWLTTDIHKPNTGSIAYIAGANVYLFKHVKLGLDAGGQHDSGPKGWGSVVFAQIMPYF